MALGAKQAQIASIEMLSPIMIHISPIGRAVAVILTSVWCSTITSNAQIALATYGFEINTAADFGDPTGVVAGLTASDLTVNGIGNFGADGGSGVGPAGGHGTSAANAASPVVPAPPQGSRTFYFSSTSTGNMATNTNYSTNTLAAALANDGGEYLQLTVTPQAGYTMNLATITLSSMTTVSGITSSLHLLYDSTNNGYSAADLISTSTFSNQAFTTRTFTLTGFTSITSATTFRLYVSDNTGATTNARRWTLIDNLQVNGTITPIPESSVSMFAAAGAMAFLGLRKRIRFAA